MPEQLSIIPDEPSALAPRVKGRFEMPPDPVVKAEAPAAPKAAPAAKAPAEAIPTDGQNTEEQAPSATPEGEKPDTEKDDPEKQRGLRRFERRLDKAYRRAAEAEARANLLAKQVEEFKPQAAVDAEAPTLEKFNFDAEKYADAKAEYAKKQAVKEFQSKEQERRNSEAISAVNADWEKKASKGEDKYDDFESKVGALDPRNPMVFAIMQADNGEEIAYHLGTHPKEAERIFKMNPVSAIREIGKLEAKLSATPEKPKAPSKAPAPIETLKGTAPIASDLPSDNDDTAAWIKKRQRQVHGKR